MSGPESEWTGFAELSRKHREVLDHLIEHKTSKEISRLLGISPHTVDQRLDSMRSRLGLASRSELASAYRRYLEQSGEIYERLTYENFHIGVEAVPVEEAERESAEALSDATSPVHDEASGEVRDGAFAERSGAEWSGAKRSGGRSGKLADRLVIVFVAVLILVILVAGFGNVLQAARNLLD